MMIVIYIYNIICICINIYIYICILTWHRWCVYIYIYAYCRLFHMLLEIINQLIESFYGMDFRDSESHLLQHPPVISPVKPHPCMGKSPCFMGKYKHKRAIFHCNVSLAEGNIRAIYFKDVLIFHWKFTVTLSFGTQPVQVVQIEIEHFSKIVRCPCKFEGAIPCHHQFT